VSGANYIDEENDAVRSSPETVNIYRTQRGSASDHQGVNFGLETREAQT